MCLQKQFDKERSKSKHTHIHTCLGVYMCANSKSNDYGEQRKMTLAHVLLNVHFFDVIDEANSAYTILL